MAHRVTLIPGDGIGPELTDATRRVLEATGVEFDWDVQQAGLDVMDRTTATRSPNTSSSRSAQNGTAIKGPITTPVGGGFRSVNVALRKMLDLYGQVRPVQELPGRPLPLRRTSTCRRPREHRGPLRGRRVRGGRPSDADELLDWLGADGHGPHPPRRRASRSSRSPRPARARSPSSPSTTRAATAAARSRRSHKANIMKFTDGLFLTSRARSPTRTATSSSRTGSSTTSRCSSCSGPRSTTCSCSRTSTATSSPTSAPAWSAASASRRARTSATSVAVFEPTHGSAPKYAGQNKVNPMAMMLSGVLMLRHLDESDAADRLENAIAEVIAEGKSVTYDMKPSPRRPDRRRHERGRRRDHREAGRCVP